MSDTSAFGFGQFVPGFDFLQNLSKTASQAQPAAAAGMPGMASWVAPTLSIEDIDKRIQELKSVLFWLEQNTTALKATIQAMEVQKMTLTTLQSMNVNMADLAKAFTAKPPVAEPAAAAAEAAPAPGASAGSAPAPRPSLFTPKAAPQAQPDPEVQTATATPAEAAEPAPASAPSDSTATDAGKPAVDPMQWWGALTQQFQGIAAAALKDVAGEAMKAGMAAKAATQAATKAKAPTARKAATGSKGQAVAASSRDKPTAKATATQGKTTRAAPAKSTRSATQPTTKSATAAPRKAPKK
jgi:hypothetical protein